MLNPKRAAGDGAGYRTPRFSRARQACSAPQVQCSAHHMCSATHTCSTRPQPHMTNESAQHMCHDRCFFLFHKQPLRGEAFQANCAMMPAQQDAPQVERAQNCTHCSAVPTQRQPRPGPDEERERQQNSLSRQKTGRFEARQRTQTHERGRHHWVTTIRPTNQRPETDPQNRGQN